MDKLQESRFWFYIDRSLGPYGCWPWTGTRHEFGYGKFETSILGRRKTRHAHRVAYETAFGPIADGLFVCHRCDNPSCCNPIHLFLGTHVDNMRDMVRKGRARGGALTGDRNGRAKLTDGDVLEIRALAQAGKLHCEIAQRFDVHRNTIRKIVRGQSRSTAELAARAFVEARG